MSFRRGTDITARNIALSDLLDGIEAGEIVLPAFQRDFEWQETEVASLVATVMAGWPAGSLLLMRGRPKFFEPRPFEGSRRQADSVQYVVLDGQQRLTALYNALRNSGEHVYAVDLSLVETDSEMAERLEEAIKIYKRPEWEALWRGTSTLVPLYALTSAADYFEWRDGVVERAPEGERRELSAQLSAAYKDFLGTVNTYQFPAVILERDLPSAAVARIFERINKGGLRLSTFDLLVARAYTDEWNLRDRWDSARADTDLIELYLGDDGLPLVQAMSLRSTRRDIRRPALLALDESEIRQGWDGAVDAMESALEFVASSGMRHPNWLPYKTLVIPLAALAHDHDLSRHRDLLDGWLWTRSFNQEYDVASSTKAAADYLLLDEVMRGVAAAPSFNIDLDVLWRATRRGQAALWRCFLSFLLRAGAIDPYRGAPLVQTPDRTGDVAVSSLFAKRSTPDPLSPHLWILSQVLIERGAQHKARGRSTLAAILDVKAREPAAFGPRLRSQFLNGEALVDAAGNPEGLMRERLALIRESVDRELSHVQVAPGRR